MISCIRRALFKFRREDGGVTVEFVMWLPIFVAVLCLVADASLIFGGKAQVLRIVQDSNRAMSVGRFKDTEAAKAYITERIDHLSPHADVAITVTAGIVRTVVTIPASDLTATNFGILDSIEVSVISEQMLEA